MQHNLRNMSTENEVLFETKENSGVITLNRPKALNALNKSMAEKILTKLKQWENEKSVVIVKGTKDKVFCAGGDISTIAKLLMQGECCNDIMKMGYTVYGIIGTYKIPYITLIDGTVMGAGAGLSVNGPYRIATERTIFAMPETIIGLYPDCGGSHFLSHLEGKLGLYLGLLSYKLKGSDVLKAGIATHYVESKNLEELEEALVQCKNRDDVNLVLEKFSVTDDKEFSLKPHLDKINKCFDAETVEEIIENLEEDGSKWAQDTLKTLARMCPTSLKVTLKVLGLGRKMNLLDCLIMEYRVTNNCFANKNFREGVRALLIDKDQNPKWAPGTLAEVTDEFVDSHFLKLPGDDELVHEIREKGPIFRLNSQVISNL